MGMSVEEPDGDFVDVAVSAAHLQVAVVWSAHAAFKVLYAHCDVVVARRAAGLPAHVLGALGADLGALRGQRRICILQPLVRDIGQPLA